MPTLHVQRNIQFRSDLYNKSNRTEWYTAVGAELDKRKLSITVAPGISALQAALFGETARPFLLPERHEAERLEPAYEGPRVALHVREARDRRRALRSQAREEGRRTRGELRLGLRVEPRGRRRRLDPPRRQAPRPIEESRCDLLFERCLAILGWQGEPKDLADRRQVVGGELAKEGEQLLGDLSLIHI